MCIIQHSAITGFSPHYLMFSHQPHLPIDYYFPVDQVTGKAKLVDEYMSLVMTLKSTFKAAREVTQEEAAHRKRLYDRKASVVTLKIGDIMLVRTDAYQGKRKSKDQWGDVIYRVVAQVDKSIPVYIVKNQHGR